MAYTSSIMSLLYFKYLVSVSACGPESPRGHTQPSTVVDFGCFVAVREHQNFPYWRLIKIVILWVYYTIPFGLTLLYLRASFFQLLN